jgi:hypothetical protein
MHPSARPHKSSTHIHAVPDTFAWALLADLIALQPLAQFQLGHCLQALPSPTQVSKRVHHTATRYAVADSLHTSRSISKLSLLTRTPHSCTPPSSTPKPPPPSPLHPPHPPHSSSDGWASQPTPPPSLTRLTRLLYSPRSCRLPIAAATSDTAASSSRARLQWQQPPPAHPFPFGPVATVSAPGAATTTLLGPVVLAAAPPAAACIKKGFSISWTSGKSKLCTANALLDQGGTRPDLLVL